MAAYPSQDKRPLKKSKLGPPDVYPQDPKQKEDELTSTSVKLGFSNIPHFNDEYGSAKNANISQEKFGAFFSQVMTKKIELNTWSDSSKKKPQIMKDNFWPVTAPRKHHMEAWFKDLAGTKPLAQLSRKVPSFNKKEEVFTILCDFHVPMIKAAWFIKMTAAHYVAMQENKTKKRQAVDQSLEWSQGLTKFMREQLGKVQEFYHGSPATGPVTSFLTATQAPLQVDLDGALKYWHYCSKLARHMYDEGLMDRQEFLSWFIELVEKTKQTDDTILKLVLSQLLQYLDEISMSGQLSRRLAYACSKRISQMCNDSGCASPRTQSPMLNSSTNGNSNSQVVSQQNPLAAVFAEFNNCPQHRGIILSLSACLQVITMNSPSALVWNNLYEGKSCSPYCGSPLDLLPCAPSCLPMPPSEQNQQIRAQVRAMEYQIRLRSRAAEVRWSSDKCQQSTTGSNMSRVLSVLDILDRHNFDKVEKDNCLESLYIKIFSSSLNKDGSEPLQNDEPVINLLVDWAVSTKRHRAHRAVVVAKLLEKRQADIRIEKYGDTDMLDDKDSTGSDMMVPPSTPVFQGLLLKFLDTKAPVLEDSPNEENRAAFANLIHVFSELIRHDVFSHDAYLCTLISRGDLMSATNVTMPTAVDSVDPSSIKSQVESINHEHQDDIVVGMDIHTMESDLGTLFDGLNAEKHSPPPSNNSVKSEKELPTPGLSKPPDPPRPPMMEMKGPSRHMQYATHFPLPQDDTSSHESNQRLAVLFGVGKARDNARHILKKVSKEILRLYSRKNCIDVSSGDLGKPKKKKDDQSSVSVGGGNLELLFSKFQRLSYHDQHVVTSQCTGAVLEQVSSFTCGASAYLPQVENISCLFDLIEYATNVNSLLEFSVQLLKELSIVDSQLTSCSSSLAGTYTTSLCLCIVAIFRKYHSFLLISEDLTFQAFEGLIGVVKHVYKPQDCSSSERCILAYLYDVYTSCSYLKNKFQEMFTHAYDKIRATVYAEIKPNPSNLMWDPTFMIDFLDNAKSIPIDQSLIDQLNKQPANRYSFVCNTMLNICKYTLSNERLNELSVLCAELTAKCNSLSAEWLGVLKALCCSSNHNCGYIDVLTQIDVSDLSFHDNLAVFTSILIARHCFSLQDLIGYVALPSLVNPAFAGGDQDAEPGTRFTCHLLLRLFRVTHKVKMGSSYSSGGGGKLGRACVRASCDRHLLAAGHNNIDVGAVLAVLKAMLVLSDSCCDDHKAKSSSKKETKGDDIISSLLNSLDDDINMDMMLGPSGSAGMENAGLSEYSKYSLREMCSQDWVREKFLQDPEGLFNPELLMDQMLSPEQTQQLVRMICYPQIVATKMEEEEPDDKETIQRILENLDSWTLRVSLLELNLMFKQAKNNAETNNLLDNISQATIHLFHQQTEQHSRTTNNSQAAALLETMPVQAPKSDSSEKDNSIWLVAPLISKLPSGVQGRVLRQAGQVLESSNTFLAPKSKLDKERNQRSKSLLSHQPFLSLILTCLKGQDEQREGLLNSLITQLEKFINSFREMLEKYPDEAKIRNDIHETLQLRLSLVGGMFDTIQRNMGLTTDWALLLLQLISSGVVDMESNYELFTTVLDMLNCLLLGTLVPDPSDKADDTRKTHTNLVKKLRKELGDKQFDATDKIRQLLPLSKRYYEVITVEPHGTLVDTKGNKIQGFDSIKRKQGLQVGKVEVVSPWDVIEGTKNPPPLSWTFFGGVRVEKKPLKYEEQHRLLFYHSHSLQKPISYYLDPPILPPEELEPPPEKVPQQEEKTIKEAPVKVQPVDPKSASAASKRRRKAGRQSSTSSSSYSQPTMPRPYSYTEPYPQQGPPSNWYGPPQTQQQPPYMAQQPMQQAPGPRFSPNFSPKQAIQTMLRARQPGTGGGGPGGSGGYLPPQSMGPMMHKQRQHQLVRHRLQQLGHQNQQNRVAENQAMYGGGGGGGMPPGTTPPGSGMMAMSQGPDYGSGGQMNPSYQSGFPPGMQSQPPSMEPMGNQPPGGMMPTGSYSQPYSGPPGVGSGPGGGAGGGMMSSMPQQSYMAQQSQPPQAQYSSQSRIPMGSSGMNPSSMSSMGSYSQMGGGGSVGPGPGPGPGSGGAYMQRIPTPQQQQQLQQMRQQQLMMRQKQQQQQQQMQPTNQQQQTAALVAQLQRQMTNPGHPQQQPAPQYSNYQQGPQY